MIASLYPRETIGFLDRDVLLHGRILDGLTVFGGHDAFADYPGVAVALGIGTNDERKRLYDALTEAGVTVWDTRHPSVIVNVGATIGKNVILNTGCLVEHDCRIGDHAHLCPGAVLCGGVTVGEGAVVGAGATVKDGVTIGAWATVGCGAVVVKDVPAGVTVVGNPAHVPGTDSFDEDGFCVVRRFVDPAPLEVALQEALAQEVPLLVGRAITMTQGAVNSLHGLHTAALETVLHSDRMRGLASLLLGEPVLPRAVEAFVKPARVGLKSPWHQDNAYWCLEPALGCTIWIALDACDAENGGVTYFRGTHRGGLKRHQPSYAPGSSQEVVDGHLDRYDKITPSLQPGDVLVHHCLTIHGSEENRSHRPRRGVTLQYTGASTRVNQAKRAAYEAALETQVRGRA
jgi:sugar O-acyltransferase (sialic acid O-acetyltransferase NeuD family)